MALPIPQTLPFYLGGREDRNLPELRLVQPPTEPLENLVHHEHHEHQKSPPQLSPSSLLQSLPEPLPQIKLKTSNEHFGGGERNQVFDLRSLIPTTSNTPGLWRKIYAILTKLRAHKVPHLDVESLTQDIFLEAWTQSTPVTYQFIYHRFLNSITKRATYSSHIETFADLRRNEIDYSHDSWEGLDEPDMSHELSTKISRLISLADLTPSDYQVLYFVYYQDQALVEVAKNLNRTVSSVTRQLETVVDKLKRVGRRVVE